jgi:hypothetical protein
MVAAAAAPQPPTPPPHPTLKRSRPRQAARAKVVRLLGLLAATDVALSAAEEQTALLWRLAARHEAAHDDLAQLGQLWGLPVETDRLPAEINASRGATRTPATGAPDGVDCAELAADAAPDQHEEAAPWQASWWPLKAGAAGLAAVGRSILGASARVQGGGESGGATSPSAEAGADRAAHTHAVVSQMLMGWEGAEACQGHIQASPKGHGVGHGRGAAMGQHLP